MAESKLPGRSFAYMANLLNLNFQVLGPTPVGTELMLAIFWEETFFNNILQTGSGNAVGFGQTEPYEFYRFDANGKLSQLAAAKGYLVQNLPPRNGKKLLGTLDDYTSVRVACAMVRDLFERGVRSKRSILNAYGGVGFKGPQPEHLAKEGGREAIIQGMLNCEDALKNATGQDDVINALKKARDFNQDDEFRKILFPNQEVLEYT
ncbi:MAG: hypothetical protein R2747_15905 [Pyrinomonadaceae bacterium]